MLGAWKREASVDLYGSLLEKALFPLFEAARGRPTVSLLRSLEHTQWWSLDQLHAVQTGLLRRLLIHAHRHTPHYREVMEARGISGRDVTRVEDLAHMPLLDRQTVRARLDQRTADWPPVTVEKSTSGTTGEPVVVRYDAESRHWRDATRWRGYGWAGYRVGMKAMHYWGAAQVPAGWLRRGKVEVDHRLKRDVYLDCTLRDEASLMHAVQELRRLRPQVVVAFSAGAGALARFVNDRQLRDWDDVPVLLGAERLWPHERAAIEAALGPAFETYGCRETMLIAAECEAHDGMHTAMETLIVELVVREPDGTVRAARPGETGEVAVTDLHNLACPMIRYLTGDLAVARDQQPCACGRALARIGPIEGRVTQTLHDGRGNPVGGLVFNSLFGAMEDVARQFQVVQRADSSVVLKVVPARGSELSTAAEAALRQVAARYLPGVAFTIDVVSDIPLSSQGKRKVVVVEQP